MKTYPSIDKHKSAPGTIYAFDKLDGSNIRAEWSKKRGEFYKFGSRTQLIDESTLILGPAVNLIKEKYEDLLKVLHDNKFQKAVCFFEFHGPSSFAGSHKEGETKTVTLFDISGDRGLVYPKDYLKLTESIEKAPLLYQGNLNSDLISLVEEGKLEGMTFEGVICKANSGSPGLPWMTKIKNKAWIDKLKNYCGPDDDKFKRLL